VSDATEKLENTLLIEGIVRVIERVKGDVDTLKLDVDKKINITRVYVDQKFNELFKGVQKNYEKSIRLDDRLQKVEKIKVRNGKDGEKGADGYVPKKGVDYFDGIDGKDGDDGKDGKSIKGEKGTDGLDGTTTIKTITKEKELSGEKYIEKIESSRRKLDASAIKNLPKMIEKVYRIGSNGIRTFTGMEDTPKTIEAGKYLKGSSNGKRLEWTTGGTGGGTVETVVAGDNVAVDSTDPANPIVSAVSCINIDGGMSDSVYGGISFNFDGGNA